uniref:Rho GTPase-activating protein 7-like n=1 Tax=Hirondellea gigas TaxID=1518452 RepID=A0A2P2I3D8_9CRUS
MLLEATANFTTAEGGKMLDVEPPLFKRSGSERIKDGAKAFLKRMESIKTKKKKKPNRDGLQISEPFVTDNAALESRVAELGCIDLRQDLRQDPHQERVSNTPPARRGAPRHRSLSRHTTSQGEDSSSLASDQSQTSTPLFRSRRRKRFFSTKEDSRSNASDQSAQSGLSLQSERSGESRGGFDGGGGVCSDSECSPPNIRHYLVETSVNTMNDLNQQRKVTHREKRSSPDSSETGGGPGRSKRPTIKHSASLNATHMMTDTKEDLLIHFRRKADANTSPLPSPNDERHSIYDNVPLIICNKSYQDCQRDLLMDSASTSAPEGSGSSECCTAESNESPCPEPDPCATPQPDQHLLPQDRPPKKRASIDRWHSFNSRKVHSSSDGVEDGMRITQFSVGQLLILKKRALLRLTALMEHHCPTSRSTWNWELPKFMFKKLRAAEQKSSDQVFGIGVHVTHKKTGYPLPPVITDALSHLEIGCIDQVGLFRKPGVRSRIQKLRELLDSGEVVDYNTYGAFDVADVVKTYFRELPEVLLTNKLSEVFLTIFQFLPEQERLEAVQCALIMMPDENREALMTLLTFLASIASNSHLNQMTASNLAVCLAPSLFHLSVGGSGSSPLRRKNTSGSPEQKDLHDNKAAHICLQMMIQQVNDIAFISGGTLAKIRFTYLETSQPVSVEDLGLSCIPLSGLNGNTLPSTGNLITPTDVTTPTESVVSPTSSTLTPTGNILSPCSSVLTSSGGSLTPVGTATTPSGNSSSSVNSLTDVCGIETSTPQHSTDWAAYMDACISALIKEVKEKNRAYVNLQHPDPELEVIYRKVGDGHPLRLWKVTAEVEAPPAELLNRVLRERHLWDETMHKWRQVAKLDHQSEVFQYICKSMPPKPMNDFCVLRCWRSDMGRTGGSCVLVETSVEHPEAPQIEGCTRGIVLVSRYLIQPCGSGKSRVTHISRIDLRGRSPEWYNKVYGGLAANKVAKLRDSFKHYAEGPESKV